MTVNLDEAVHAAGGVIVGEDGKPNVATPEALQGLQTLTDWFNNGHIPEAALTWRPAQGRKAFQKGELILHRNWGVVYSLANTNDGSSRSWASSMWRRCPVLPVLACPVSAAKFRDRQVRGQQGHGGGLPEIHVIA